MRCQISCQTGYQTKRTQALSKALIQAFVKVLINLPKSWPISYISIVTKKITMPLSVANSWNVLVTQVPKTWVQSQMPPIQQFKIKMTVKIKKSIRFWHNLYYTRLDAQDKPQPDYQRT